MTTRVLRLALAAALVLPLTTGVADAARGRAPGTPQGGATPDVEVGGEDEEGTPGTPGGGSIPGDGSTTHCTSRQTGVYGEISHHPPVQEQQYYFDNAESFYAPARGMAGTWYFRRCGGSDDGIVFVPGPGVPLPGATDLAEAVAELTLPEPDIAVNPAVRQLVNVETWLWAEGGSLQPLSVTRRQVVGTAAVDVTITATPHDVRWDMGDGTPSFACTAADMVAYDPGRPAAGQSTGCSHTYEASSARQPKAAYTVSATSNWTVDATVNGAPALTGMAFTKSSTTPLAVAERQTLNR